jgi:tetrahydromethanopterin S-methyltransferase subunit B
LLILPAQEVNYTDGWRMAYFSDMAEVQAKMTELERVVKELVKMMDEEE